MGCGHAHQKRAARTTLGPTLPCRAVLQEPCRSMLVGSATAQRPGYPTCHAWAAAASRDSPDLLVGTGDGQGRSGGRHGEGVAGLGGRGRGAGTRTGRRRGGGGKR